MVSRNLPIVEYIPKLYKERISRLRNTLRHATNQGHVTPFDLVAEYKADSCSSGCILSAVQRVWSAKKISKLSASFIVSLTPLSLAFRVLAPIIVGRYNLSHGNLVCTN